MKQKLKNSIEINKKIKIRNTQRGITLVALVITIIVLLILAMVSVKIAIDGGLITKASKATDTHTIGAEKEAIQTGYASYQMAIVKGENVSKPTIKGAEVLEEPNNSWLVRFKKNTYTIDNNGVTLGPIKSEVDMSIKEGDKVFHLYRLRIRNNVPLMIENSYINYEQCEGLEAHNFAEESLYKVLRDLGILLTKGTEKVEITFATEEEAKLLKVEEGQYLYYQSGVVNDDRGVGIEFFRIMARPDQVQYTNVLTRRDTR